ncbi:hypothetical protein ALC57_01766, partial [Trachymyrmex cornetzi]
VNAMLTPVEYICKHKPTTQSPTLSRTTGSTNNGRLAGCTTSHHGVADSSQSGRMRPGAVNRGSSVNARGYVDRGIEHGTAKFIVDGGRCARVKYDDYDRNEIGSPTAFPDCGTFVFVNIFAAAKNVRADMRACAKSFFIYRKSPYPSIKVRAKEDEVSNIPACDVFRHHSRRYSTRKKRSRKASLRSSKENCQQEKGQLSAAQAKETEKENDRGTLFYGTSKQEICGTSVT